MVMEMAMEMDTRCKFILRAKARVEAIPTTIVAATLGTAKAPKLATSITESLAPTQTMPNLKTVVEQNFRPLATPIPIPIPIHTHILVAIAEVFRRREIIGKRLASPIPVRIAMGMAGIRWSIAEDKPKPTFMTASEATTPGTY